MPKTTVDLVIGTTRGGMNNSDSAIALSEDQCVLAQNVEWTTSQLGERRLGSDAIDLTGAAVGSRDKITFAFRHLPSTDETASELWLVGLTGTATLSVSKKTTSWADVTVSDTPLKTGFAPYRWQGLSLHGKLFLAYDSDVDRLHVWDGTSMRRVGLAEPAAPTGANDGGVGTFSGTRYYRVRYTVQASSVTIRRSEPSDALTFAPNGNDTGITVTKPASISEGETHWELEASTDNATFYRIATTVVGTTTVTDTTDFVSGYASVAGAVLSEDTGDYTLLPSARYLTSDEDRLFFAGSYETNAQASRVGWTPVTQADGVGNDERLEDDTDPTLDLDGYNGGVITGISSPVLGTIWIFKERRIYKMVRRGIRSKAYEAHLEADGVGAIHGSVVNGVDQLGNPCVYFIDLQQGPMKIGGREGLQPCGADISATWSTLNANATQVTSTGLYFPGKNQVHWWIPSSAANAPDTHIVLHVNLSRTGVEGTTKGWAIWTGLTASALCACLYANNIDDNAARSRTLVPFVGLSGNGLCHRTETGDDDNGTEYVARIITKPYTPSNILHKFGTRTAVLLAKAVASSSIDIKIQRDFALETDSTVSAVSMAATGSETQVFKLFDNFDISDARVVQIEFVDPSTPGPRWELNQFVLGQHREATA